MRERLEIKLEKKEAGIVKLCCGNLKNSVYVGRKKKRIS